MNNKTKTDILHGFIGDALTLLDEAVGQVTLQGCGPEGVQAIFRCLHTLKGTSGFLELLELSKYVHKIEDFARVKQDQGLGLTETEGHAVLHGLELLQKAVNKADQPSLLSNREYQEYLETLLQLQVEEVSLEHLETILLKLRSELAGTPKKTMQTLLMPVIKEMEALSVTLQARKTKSVMPLNHKAFQTIRLQGKDISELMRGQLSALEQVSLEGKIAFKNLDRKALDTELDTIRNMLPAEKRNLVTWDMIEDLCDISPEIAPEAFERLWTDGIIAAGAEVIMAQEEEDTKTPEPAVQETEESEDEQREGETAENDFFRVSGKVLDEIVHVAGSLVANRNNLENLILEMKNHIPSRYRHHVHYSYGELNRNVSIMEQKVSRLSNRKLNEVFQRLPFLAAQLAGDMNKEVQVETSGTEIEIPRSLIKALNDPLIHIVRNSLDHGIEKPKERKAAGKPKAGRLRIQANRDDNNLTVTIEDDGHGIDLALVRDKAISQSLINKEDQLDDNGLMSLIFHPGFTTNNKVTNVSGRGVGMSVVTTAIEGKGGRVKLDTESGKGTTIKLLLPLDEISRTKDVQLIEAGGEMYGIEYRFLVEVLEFEKVSLHSHGNGCFFSYRDELIPFVTLTELLGCRTEDDECHRILIIQDEQDCRLACGINRIRHKIKVVVTPFLHGFLKNNPVVAGAAVTGSGEPCSILAFRDINALLSIQ